MLLLWVLTTHGWIVSRRFVLFFLFGVFYLLTQKGKSYKWFPVFISDDRHQRTSEIISVVWWWCFFAAGRSDMHPLCPMLKVDEQ